MNVAPPTRRAIEISRPLVLPKEQLLDAVRCILEPWTERAGPESTFHFAIREDTERDAITLLSVENDGSREPSILADFEVRDNKIGVMQNNTDFDFDTQLLEQGVLRQEIV